MGLFFYRDVLNIDPEHFSMPSHTPLPVLRGLVDRFDERGVWFLDSALRIRFVFQFSHR